MQIVFDPTYTPIKALYDSAGYLSALGATAYFSRSIFRSDELPRISEDPRVRMLYLLSVFLGSLVGGILISTFDTAMIPGHTPAGGMMISKSIAGALFGGVITAEIYKYIHQISIPTGILFLPGILIGVFIGRFGAIATGLRDFTYGIPTTLPWGVDFGDGVYRHPTMIYEMILLLLFFIVMVRGLARTERKWWIERGFSAFLLIYFLYRHFVGYIQPYSEWWWGLSTYQVIAIPMVIYALWGLTRDLSSSSYPYS